MNLTPLRPTTKQINFVQSLQRQLHCSDELLDRHCENQFGCDFDGLDRSQVSTLIDELLTWKDVPVKLQRVMGQQDLPGMEGR